MVVGRSGAVLSAAVLFVVVLTSHPTPTAAQFIVQSHESKCPTNRYFLSSLEDIQAGFAPFSGVYMGSDAAASDSSYRHELGHATLRSYATETYGSAVQTLYIEDSEPPASTEPARPAPGPVVEGEPASPLAYLRSFSPNGTSWEVWSEDHWENTDATFPGRDADAVCASGVRLRCVSAAWRCPAGRLHVSGLPVGVMAPATLTGRLLGADQPAFSKEPVTDDGPAVTVDAPLPATSDTETDVDANRLHLGTFLTTGEVHMNRPLYRHAGDGGATFLYFDRLRTSSDSVSLPLWIIGPQPSQVDMAKSRLLFAVDSAARPEEITGCWQYLAAGRQGAAYLNATCEHGRTPPGPLNGADCGFELPGACGYRTSEGLLSQQPYSDDQLSKVMTAGDSSSGRFFAQLTSSDGGVADVLSRPFEASSNSCISLYYRMSTESFFGATFTLKAEADGAVAPLLTMHSAERGWMSIARNVTAGRYRLHVRTTELAASDKLQIDSVRVTPGACGRFTSFSPCSRQPCANGGTCVPSGATSYTCLCQGQFQGRNCRPSSPCPRPPKVTHGAPQLVPAPEDVLPTARYTCRSGFELSAPLSRSVATCLDGRWRGVPECRRSSGAPAEVGPGKGAAGRVSSTGVTAVAALVVLTAFRAGP